MSFLLVSLFSIAWISSLLFFSHQLAFFNRRLLLIPLIPVPQVLGEFTSDLPGSKRIEIDLAKQRLYAFTNNQLTYDYLISSGKWNQTPRGTFTIWSKIRSQKMSGGSMALGTYYYLPNVPHIVFFSNLQYPRRLGFSIHGAYWHNNFGRPMSHGCINMKTSDAAQIFAWADFDTSVIIY